MQYTIHLNERGCFFATIDDANGNEVLKIDTEESEYLVSEGIDILDGAAVIEYYMELGTLEAA